MRVFIIAMAVTGALLFGGMLSSCGSGVIGFGLTVGDGWDDYYDGYRVHYYNGYRRGDYIYYRGDWYLFGIGTPYYWEPYYYY